MKKLLEPVCHVFLLNYTIVLIFDKRLWCYLYVYIIHVLMCTKNYTANYIKGEVHNFFLFKDLRKIWEFLNYILHQREF